MQRADEQIPPRTLPIVYFAIGHLGLLLAGLLVALQPEDLVGFFYHPKMFAGVHLITLGWITASILGATYVVAPFALRTTLVASKADAWACAAMCIGASGVVSHFWLDGYWGVVTSGGLLCLGLVFFAQRVWRALGKAKVPVGVRLLIGLAFTNLLLAGLLGILLGINKILPFLPGQHLDWVFGHVHLAVAGWALMMVLGVGYRLFPMFLPALPPAGRSSLICAALLQVGVVGFASTVPFAPVMSRVSALLMAAGLAVFLFDIGRMFANRRKRPPQLPWPDLGLLHAFQALIYLLLSVVLGLAMLFRIGWQLDWIMIYGTFGLLGFLGQMVLGMGMRLLPMFAWTVALHRGGFDTHRPPPHDMPWRLAQWIVLATWTPAVPLLAYGLASDRIDLVRSAGALLTLAAILVSANAVRTFRYAYPRAAIK